MGALDDVAVADVLRALKVLGFEVVRQRGSHMILRHTSKELGCVVPNHRTVKSGTLRSVLKQAQLSREEFLRALNA